MKNRMKQFLVLLLAAALVLGNSSAALAADGPVKKDESVYLILNEDGSVKEQIVSEWLHSDSGFHGYEDKTVLTDVENLKSETQPRKTEDGLVWDTDERDLYYQSKSASVQVPVSAFISYRLDGRDISAEELKGRSGHLEIAVSLANNLGEEVTVNGKKRTVYTPFFTVCAALLPADSFQNVAAEHGMVQTDSKNTLACFLALPGLSESLGDLIPDGFGTIRDYLLDDLTISADVTDCAVPTFLFTAASSLEGLSDTLDEPELSGQMEKLKDATHQLQDGAKALDEAVGTLQEKLGEFSTGYAEFDQGVDAALSGAQQLSRGSLDLLSGAQLLSQKSGELAAGAGQLRDGAQQLSTQLSTQLVPGLTAAKGQEEALKQKMSALSSQLGGLQIPDLAGLKTQLSAGVGQVFDGAASGAAAAGASAAGQAISQQLSASLGSVDLNASAGQAVSAVQGADLQVVQAVLQNPDLGLTPEQQGAISAAVQGGMGQASGTLTAEIAQSMGAVMPQLPQGNPISEEAAQKIAQAVCSSEQMQAAKANAVAQVGAAIPNIDTTQLSGMMGQFQSLASDSQSMLAQVDALTSALYDPSDPGSQKTVVGAAKSLASGAQALSDGASALTGGTQTLSSGAQELSQGVSSLYSGMETLSSSSKTVASSIGQFRDGGAQLKEGTAELKDGMDAFADEAVGKLTKLGDPDSDLGKVLDLLKERADSYEGAGCGENTELTVKFIMRTAAPKAEEPDGAAGSSDTEAPLPEKSLWDRIKELFS